MALALDEGIGQFNLESEEEAGTLSAVASELGLTARVAFRVNPDVDAGTHAKISTGRSENKFGIAYDLAPAVYARAAALPGLVIAGRRRPYRQPAHRSRAARDRPSPGSAR